MASGTPCLFRPRACASCPLPFARRPVCWLSCCLGSVSEKDTASAVPCSFRRWVDQSRRTSALPIVMPTLRRLGLQAGQQAEAGRLGCRSCILAQHRLLHLNCVSRWEQMISISQPPVLFVVRPSLVVSLRCFISLSTASLRFVPIALVRPFRTGHIA
jgi:hypothetical protein